MTNNETQLISLLNDAYQEGFEAKGSDMFIPITLTDMAKLLSSKTYVEGKIYIIEDEHNS